MARIKSADGERRVGAAGKRGRRKWPVVEKVRIVQELEGTGGPVSEVARRHGAHTSMLTRWRTQYRAGQLGTDGAGSAAARLMPVRVVHEAPRSSRPAREPAPAVSCAGAIEVRLASGQQLRIRGTVEAGMLRAVLEELARS